MPTKHGTAAEWYVGSVEEAFDLAEKRSVPVFLFWSAKWCPPCHQLKAEVFNRPRFAELMQLVVPVYLDGDTDEAQQWAEKLNVHGYPTMLMLGPLKEERMRLQTFVNLAEFDEAFSNALLSKASVKDILEKAAKGTATEADWRLLAYGNWAEARGTDPHSASVLINKKMLADKVPAKLKKEKALLSAAVLLAAAEEESGPAAKIHQKWIDSVRKDSAKYLNAILENYDTILVARGTLLYSAKEVIGFVAPKAGPERTTLEGRWLLAAKLIGNGKEISLDTRLWSVFPELQLYQVSHPDEPVSPQIVNEVKRRVEEVTTSAGDTSEREAILSGAAHLLGLVGASGEARALLRAEVGKSSTPWYYESSLAQLEDREKQGEQALYWSDRARRSAKGQATKLQWTALDMKMTLQYSKDLKRVKEIAESLYAITFSLSDGFMGRNLKYLKEIEAPLKQTIQNEGELKAQLQTFAAKCASLEGLSQQRCRSHFQAILG